jgi:hypothetical protein
MKLSELKTEGNFKGLFIGPPGNRKTCTATSFPYPILLLDFDNKADSAALFYKEDKPRLEGIDVRQLGDNLTKDPMVEMNSIIEKELIPMQKSGDFAYKTIIIDSITTFSSAVLKHIVQTNPGIKRNATKQGVQPCLQDYGILKREFARLIPGILSLPCNIIMTAHVDVTKDELTGAIQRRPLMDGAFSAQLPIYFKEVWSFTVDKDRTMVQTQSDRKFDCRSQIKGLPNPFDFTDGYKALEKYLK